MQPEQVERDVRCRPSPGADDGDMADFLERGDFVGGQGHFASVVEPASLRRPEQHRDRITRIGILSRPSPLHVGTLPRPAN